jgi:hypothetical protein
VPGEGGRTLDRSCTGARATTAGGGELGSRVFTLMTAAALGVDVGCYVWDQSPGYAKTLGP